MQDLTFSKIKSSSIVEQIIDALTNAIINGQLKPGDKIPTETELMELLGVGRNSIREAIKMLISYGVLEIRRAEGTFVKQGFSGIMLNPLLFGVILSSSSSSQLALMELRELIEIGLMKLAKQKLTPDSQEELIRQYHFLAESFEEKPRSVQAVFQADNLFCLSESNHRQYVYNRAKTHRKAATGYGNKDYKREKTGGMLYEDCVCTGFF